MVVCFVLQVYVFAGKHPKVGVCLFCGVGLLDTENGLGGRDGCEGWWSDGSHPVNHGQDLFPDEAGIEIGQVADQLEMLFSFSKPTLSSLLSGWSIA